MKKALILLLLVGCFALPGFAEETPAAEQLPLALTEGPAMTPVPADVATALPFPGPVFCGDLCQTAGACRGCVDTSTGVWRKVECICQAGRWACIGCF